MQGDASHDRTLLEAGIDKAQALCTVLPNDAMNVFITLTARNLNHEITIIARGEYPETEPKLIQAGASRVVLPSATSASHMADIITRPVALDFLKESELSALDKDLEKLGLRMMTLALDDTARGRTVGDLEKEAEVSLMVVALLRKGGGKGGKPCPRRAPPSRRPCRPHRPHGACALDLPQVHRRTENLLSRRHHPDLTWNYSPEAVLTRPGGVFMEPDFRRPVVLHVGRPRTQSTDVVEVRVIRGQAGL